MGNDDDLIVLAAGVEDGEIAAASGNNPIEVRQSTVADGGDVDVGGVTGGGRGGGFDGNSRVWTMRDLMTKYPEYRGYANSGLSNFAWAQAVQNKPLSEGLGKEYETREGGGGGGDKIVIEDSDDEKEEGELEEGEIDLDSTRDDEMETESLVVLTSVADEVEDDRVHKERELETKVKLIRDVLESTSLVQAQM